MSDEGWIADILPGVIYDWITLHPDFVRYAIVASAIVFVGSIVAMPFLVAAIPTDYFATKRAPISRAKLEHPVLRLLVLAAKNFLGVGFLLAGIVMLVTPGQGVLSILVGLSLLNFPGKRTLELAIVRKPAIKKAVDWMREKRGKPPLTEVYTPESCD